MNETDATKTTLKEELDAGQAANVGGGECGSFDPYPSGGLADAYARAYEWLVDTTSEAIERLANSLK